MGTWTQTNKSMNWAHGLQYVQFQKNRSHHSRMGMTPCMAVYGQDASIGLATSSLPQEIYARPGIIEEEDLHAMYSDDPALGQVSAVSEDTDSEMIAPSQNFDPPQETTEENLTPEDDPNLHSHITPDNGEAHCFTGSPEQDLNIHHNTTPDISETQSIIDTPVEDIHYITQEESELQTGPCSVCGDELGSLAIMCAICFKMIHPHCANNETCCLCIREGNRTSKRKHVQVAQEKQANKMIKASESRLPILGVGDNVRVPVPNVDRGCCDPPHLLGVVTDVTVHNNYRIGTRVGNLKGTFARNQVEKCKQVFVSQENVPETVLSVRSAATANSVGSGQGFVHCNCKTGCFNNRCKCRKNELQCNSRCHKSLSCDNK